MSPARRLLMAYAALGAAFCGTAPALAACPPVTLQPRFTLATGSGPVEVVAADFTGDGVPDLVTGNYYSASLSLFPGIAPGGTFGARVDIPAGSTPQSLLATDLDGDGKLDLVVSCWGANMVQVLRGLGGGSFTAPVSFPAGAKPYDIALGDFNEDGVSDIAVADNDERSMRILIGGRDPSTGHWNGGFAPSVAYATNNLPLGITTGDFNEDGITDVVVTEYTDNTVALFLGNGSGGVGDGTFQPAVHIASGVIPYNLATGDFNEDGHLDLAVANSGDGGVHVLLGSGTGTFPTTNSFLPGVNCSGVAPADFDGDGITDLAASTAVGGVLYLMRGNGSGGVGDGTFATPTTLPDCCYSVHVMTADLNGNGRPDAVVADWTSNTLSVFMDGCVPDPNVPHITRIRDVPNDQGGKVFITWTRSALDVAGGAVNGYTVWRLVPPAGLVAHVASLAGLPADPTRVRRELRARPDGATDIDYWEALATLPAQRLEGYGYTAATPQDSLRGSNPLFTYRITATTANIDVFYDSDPDSGYSVDNLPPGSPGALTATWSAGGAALRWTANPEPDVEHYAVYRSDDPSFTPSSSTLVGTPTTSEFTDPAPHPLATYKLAAVDKHGNESPYASVDMRAVTGVGDGRAGTTWLASPKPNPAHGPFDLRYGLAREGRVTIVVLDAQGRRVRTIADGVRPAGDATLRWDARDESGAPVGAGLYWLDLRAGPQHLVRRFALVR